MQLIQPVQVFLFTKEKVPVCNAHLINYFLDKATAAGYMEDAASSGERR